MTRGHGVGPWPTPQVSLEDEEETPGGSPRGKAMWGHVRNLPSASPAQRPQHNVTSRPNIFSLDFQHPGLRKKVVVFKPLVRDILLQQLCRGEWGLIKYMLIMFLSNPTQIRLYLKSTADWGVGRPHSYSHSINENIGREGLTSSKLVIAGPVNVRENKGMHPSCVFLIFTTFILFIHFEACLQIYMFYIHGTWLFFFGSV